MEVGVIAVTLLERPRLVIRMSQRGVAEADMVGHDLHFTLFRLFVSVQQEHRLIGRLCTVVAAGAAFQFGHVLIVDSHELLMKLVCH